jgi:DNA-binding MarR family transcriptional regulator
VRWNGLVRYEPNPDHKRAKLVCLTERGRNVSKQIGKLQAAWANRVSAKVLADELAQAVALIRKLSQHIYGGD